jgi:hypothetical protein
MTRSARIGLAAALLLGGATFATAQNGPATGGYPPAGRSATYGYYNSALTQCETDQPAGNTCACGPAKTFCPKGMWCHAFASACNP